jgi:hypothetical protein
MIIVESDRSRRGTTFAVTGHGSTRFGVPDAARARSARRRSASRFVLIPTGLQPPAHDHG